jgi:adenylyltransferase/sulfurtransferase
MIVPGEGPCLRCLFPESPQEDETATCRDAGVLGPVAATIGTLEAHAALDALRGRAVPRLLRFDARSLAMRTTFPRQSPVCRVCVPQPLVLWPSEHGPKDRAHGAGSTDGEKEIS